MGRNLERLLVWVVVLVALAMVAGAAAGEEEGWSGAVPLADVEWVGLVWSAGERGVVPAVLLDAEVEIAVGGMVARSRVRQTFVNQGEEWAEGVYVFPLPENAAVDRLRMVVGERVIEGQVREKEEARREFEAARREGRRASLLEQHRPNVFTTRVTNVAPGEAVEVTIDLQQAIDYDAGRMRLRFPTVVAPRYFPGPPAAGRDEGDAAAPEVPMAVRAGDPGAVRQRAAARPAVDRRPTGAAPVEVQRPARRTAADAAAGVASLSAGCCAADEDAPLRFLADAVAGIAGRAGRALDAVAEELRPEPPPPNRLSLAVRLDSGFPLATLGSPSHDIDVTAAGARGWRVELTGQGEAADRDFELVWEPAPGRQPRAALFTEEHEGDTYALLVVLPPEPESPGWAPLAREVVFVLDTSGSMAGVAIEQARAALGTALGRLEPWDLFNVIEFDDRARPLFPASVPADPAAVERARAWVAGLEADGGTEMRQALALALPGGAGYRRGDPERVRQVVFLTDGAVGNEDELLSTIAARLGDARLFTVGIGSAPNGYFLRRAAEVGRGGFTWIGDTAEVGRAVDDLARKLEGPVLTDLELAWDDPTAEVWPQRLPDLYAGEPLVVASRLIRPGEEVRVSGRRGGVWWQETVRLAEPGATGAAGGRPSGGTAVIGRAGGGEEDSVPAAGGDGAPVAVPAVERGVRQLWARRKIDHWLGRLVEGVPEDEVRREVVAVALAHHLVSRWTSLVAVDVTPARPAGEALTAAAVPLALPEGHLPMGGTSARRDLLVGLAMMLLALPLLAGGRRKRDQLRVAVAGGGDCGEAKPGMSDAAGRLGVAVSDGGAGQAERGPAGAR